MEMLQCEMNCYVRVGWFITLQIYCKCFNLEWKDLQLLTSGYVFNVNHVLEILNCMQNAADKAM